MTLRVAVVTQDDPFYMPFFYETFFTELDRDVEIHWVTVLDPFDESLHELARRLYDFYGPVNFARLCGRYATRRAVDAVGLGRYSVESVARRHGVPTEHRQSVNTEEFVEQVEAHDIDVVLSVAAPEIFDTGVLTSPNWGCLNVHTAELPAYRGMMPTFWALYHGEDRIGVTVHTMVEEIDAGEIVRQTTFPVGVSPTLDTVVRRGKRLGARLAAESIAAVEDGSVAMQPMEGEGSYFSFPDAADRRAFLEQGGRLL
jgi:methionyl-tRNA formyltransferase